MTEEMKTVMLGSIRLDCEKRLAEEYSAGVPREVRARYEKELTFLEGSKYVEYFGLYQLLARTAHENGFPIYGRGTLMGSLLYFLLGHGRFNPMPAHYYCPCCGHCEFVREHSFGVDLPEKTCPKCGRKIYADGYDLPVESVWGIDGKKTIAFDFNIAKAFRPIAAKVLRECYPDRDIVIKGGFAFRWNEEEEYLLPAGYIVLPKGKSAKTFTQFLQYLDNGEACLLGNPLRMEAMGMKVITLIDHICIDRLCELGSRRGKVDEIKLEDLKRLNWRDIIENAELSDTARQLFAEYKPKSFREMVNLETFSHAAFAEGGADAVEIPEKCLEILRSADFRRHPCYTREDFFELLLEDGVDKEIAFDAMEIFRKGWFSNFDKIEKCNDLGLQGEYENLARKFCYVFPRAHGVEYMLMYARLALAARKGADLNTHPE